MKKIEPRLPKGMRDLEPADMVIRNRVLSIIKESFEIYGYLPLESPALEYWEILTGKYGEEAERLVYNLVDHGGRHLGLRYDLTVPLARYIASHKHLIKPFKRYQIQPVWRAEKPQKGRYREFYQCDVDVVGSESMLVDSELIAMTVDIMVKLGIVNIEVRINNRKILQGLAKASNIAVEKTADVCQTLDKVDKIGWSAVQAELERKGYNQQQITTLTQIVTVSGDNATILGELHNRLTKVEIGLEGISEMQEIMDYLSKMETDLSKVKLVPSLTRGLDYYTGPIFETFMTDRAFSSLGGGGRYNGLVGIFSKEDIPASGTSFGLDRIVTILQEDTLDQLPERTTDILVAHFSTELRDYAVILAAMCRKAGFRCELYYDSVKLKKQFNYANQKNIPFVLLIGPSEAESGTIQLKNMQTGEQEAILQSEIIEKLSAKLNDGNVTLKKLKLGV